MRITMVPDTSVGAFESACECSGPEWRLESGVRSAQTQI